MSNKYFDSFRNRAKARANGCPLMDGREKGNPDDYIGKDLTIEDAFRMNGENGNYYVITVKELPEVFFQTGGSLTDILNDANDVAETEGVTIRDVCGGLVFYFEEKTKTKSGHDFRPVRVK